MNKTVKQTFPWLGGVLVAFFLICALFAPVVSPYAPNKTDFSKRLESPSAAHWLGTDHLGRDVFSRLVHGAHVSIITALAAISCILLISLFLGCLSGLSGGVIDQVIMRLTDVLMGFPTTILAIVMVGLLGPGLVNVVIAIAITHWAWYTRIIRAGVRQLKDREFVLFSEISGVRKERVLLRHFLPVIGSQLAVLATLDMGHMMLHIAGLSFLGLGVQPPTPEWGGMINDAREYLRNHPILIIAPGLAMALAVIGFNLLGEAFRDRLDPYLNVKSGSEVC